MKWNVYVYNPKTEQTVTKVMDYPGTSKGDNAAIVVYAARDLKTQQKYILAPKPEDALTKLQRVADEDRRFHGLRIVASDRAGYAPGLHVVQYKDDNGMWFDIGDPKTKARAEAAMKAESRRLVKRR